MKKINGINVTPDTTIDPEKEVQLQKVKAEMKAGQILMEGAAKQIEKIKEQLEREHDEKNREPVSAERDTASISERQRWSRTDRTSSEDQDSSWRLEMEAELWEAFVKWSPIMNGSFSSQLQNLSDMYLALLEAVLKYTMGEEQTLQMDRLNAVLSEKLSLLMNSDLKELVTLLEESGQKEVLAGLQASVYRQTTGQSISPKEAKDIFTRFTSASPSPSFSSSPKSGSFSGNTQFFSSPSKPDSSLKEGMIYKSSGKGKVKASQGYAAQKNQWERQISQRKEVVNNARKGVVQGSGWGLKNTFTARELAQANRFAAHLNGSGDLFRQEGLTAKNEELMGLLAAVTAMKGQVYATEAGQGKAITFPLQSAIDRMIDHYLRQKAAASVYYHTISIFEKTKNPQKAVEAGFEFAYNQFQEKQDTPVFQTQSQYAEQAGFFQAFLKNQPIEKELSSGLRILEENWRDFLRAIGKERDHAFTLRLQKQSPWGSLIEPEKHRPEKKVDVEKVLLAASIILAIIAAVYLMLRV